MEIKRREEIILMSRGRLRNILGKCWLLVWVLKDGKDLGTQRGGVAFQTEGAVGTKLKK